MLELIIIVLWWMSGGLDWVTESWNDFMYFEINRLTELTNDYMEFLKLKENILNSRNLDIVEYKRQIAELEDINRILNNNLQNSKNIILELENQLYESVSEEDIVINNNNLDK